MTILAFGQIAELCGRPQLEADVSDTDALRALLQERYPALRDRTYVIAVDRKTIGGNTPLTSSSVVALLPPFSGG
jgi:molybdopterin synthase sulfur carrier subunit